MPNLDDYGGNHYGRRYRIKRCKENMRSFRCMSCSLLSYFSHRQCERAAVVRCPKCGGGMEETEPSVKRRLGVKRGNIGDVLAQGIGGRKPYGCRVCHKTFRSAVGLKLHIEEHHPEIAPEF